ncbi:MAG: (d)CMP kinase [bacterium]
MKTSKIRIAIDGPAGAGKSSTSRMVANALNLRYIDTGALYRALAWHVKNNGFSEKQEAAVKNLLDDFSVEFKTEHGINRIFLKDMEITSEIRTKSVSMAASTVSSYPFVRKALFSIQRDFADEGDVVMEGRDIATVIMPDAEYKFFLTASVESRAERRWKELSEKEKKETTLEEMIKDIVKRDKQDSERKTAPLKKAEDALEIDNSDMTLEETVDKIVSLVRKGL